MEPEPEVTAFIPVRGGSKSIPLKNIKHLHGQPLVYWVCEAAFRAEKVGSVYVATEDPRIREVVESLINRYWPGGKVKLFERDPATATDTASTESAMLDFLSRVAVKNLLLIQATSPLLTAADLDGAITQWRTAGAESLLSVVRQKRFLWESRGPLAYPTNYEPSQRPRRQDWDGFLVENGAFYLTDAGKMKATGVRLNGSVVAWEMPEETYHELDEPADWLAIEALLRARNSSSAVRDGGTIRLVVSDNDGVLTDGGMYYTSEGEVMKKFNTLDGMGFQILRERGVQVAIITGEASNILSARAKKLKVENVHLGVQNKLAVLNEIWGKTGIRPEETVYIGDDINDLEAMLSCGYRITVPNATPEILRVAHFVTKRRGGEGAFRDAVEWVLGQ